MFMKNAAVTLPAWRLIAPDFMLGIYIGMDLLRLKPDAGSIASDVGEKNMFLWRRL